MFLNIQVSEEKVKWSNFLPCRVHVPWQRRETQIEEEKCMENRTTCQVWVWWRRKLLSSPESKCWGKSQVTFFFFFLHVKPKTIHAVAKDILASRFGLTQTIAKCHSKVTCKLPIKAPWQKLAKWNHPRRFVVGVQVKHPTPITHGLYRQWCSTYLCYSSVTSVELTPILTSLPCVI